MLRRVEGREENKGAKKDEVAYRAGQVGQWNKIIKHMILWLLGTSLSFNNLLTPPPLVC